MFLFIFFRVSSVWNPDEAYMTMVTHLFPVGMVGLVLAVLTAALVSTIGSALNALSTVFTMDIYVKKIRPQAKQKEIIRVGQVSLSKPGSRCSDIGNHNDCH